MEGKSRNKFLLRVLDSLATWASVFYQYVVDEYEDAIQDLLGSDVADHKVCIVEYGFNSRYVLLAWMSNPKYLVE